jgi:hypothetical protein
VPSSRDDAFARERHVHPCAPEVKVTSESCCCCCCMRPSHYARLEVGSWGTASMPSPHKSKEAGVCLAHGPWLLLLAGTALTGIACMHARYGCTYTRRHCPARSTEYILTPRHGMVQWLQACSVAATSSAFSSRQATDTEETGVMKENVCTRCDLVTFSFLFFF